MDTPHRVQAFLEELTALSRRTGIVVWGCGCHRSPVLQLDDSFREDPDTTKAKGPDETPAREGSYIVERKREHGFLDPDWEFGDLIWLPTDNRSRRESRTTPNSTAPWVLPPINEIKGVEHALLDPGRHDFTDEEIATLEAYDLPDEDVEQALEAAYQQQDREGWRHASDRDQADRVHETEETMPERIRNADTILEHDPRNFAARRDRLQALVALARSAKEAG